jgi:cell wall-associated NlpC family hydrolase
MEISSTSEAKISSPGETPSSLTQTPDKVVEVARSFLGTRFRHQGRNEAGIDCCGLVILVARKLGLSTYDTTDYDRRTSGDMFVNHFRDAGLLEIAIRDIKAGDIIITTDANFPCHCGIASMKHGELHMVHAYLVRKMVVEEPLKFWMPKVIAAFRFPANEE